jgi:hypothetical protein
VSDAGTRRTLEVRRDDFSVTRISEEPLPAQLAPGQVLLSVDRFALTANNITYCQVGEELGYWRFFPARDPAWGRVPAMAYATVAASAHADIAVGERVWGFFPMGTHLLIEAGAVNAHGFSDESPHRQGLAPIYARFQRAAGNPIHEAAREEQDCLLRGLFLTAWLCEDFLHEAAYQRAGDCLITSASSKTAIALAQRVRTRAAARAIALTSPRNLDFCHSLGCYDDVVSYDAVSQLPNSGATIVVDMAGDHALNLALRHHYGDALRYNCLIGATHAPNQAPDDTPLPDPQPQLFFAPHQAQVRSSEWGAAEMERRIATDFAAFRRFADSWLSVRRFTGTDEAQAAFLATLRGEASPAEGYSVSLSA